jgi:hypothetical protein
MTSLRVCHLGEIILLTLLHPRKSIIHSKFGTKKSKDRGQFGHTCKNKLTAQYLKNFSFTNIKVKSMASTDYEVKGQTGHRNTLTTQY